jgi:hypothetical protein
MEKRKKEATHRIVISNSTKDNGKGKAQEE